MKTGKKVSITILSVLIFGLVRRGDHPEHDLSDGPGDAAGSYL